MFLVRGQDIGGHGQILCGRVDLDGSCVFGGVGIFDRWVDLDGSCVFSGEGIFGGSCMFGGEGIFGGGCGSLDFHMNGANL